MPKPFADGELVLALDGRGRQRLLKLDARQLFQSHLGNLPHAAIIGQEEGCRLKTHSGRELLFLRPTLSEYIMNMKRTSQIIYPKDIGPILQYGDVYPGATVVESGIGSGALTLGLLRAVGPTGKVIGYELRQDLATRAERNVRAYMPGVANLTIKLRDIYQGIEESEVDRLILDLPEPWQVVPLAVRALRRGGVLVAYVPTALQLHKVHMALLEGPYWELVESFEVLERGWYLAPTSARPNHRMVAHTGFITRATRTTPRTGRTRAQLVAAWKAEEAGDEAEREVQEALGMTGMGTGGRVIDLSLDDEEGEESPR